MKQYKRAVILCFAFVVALLVMVGNIQYSDYRLDKALLKRLEIKQNSNSEHLEVEIYKRAKKFVQNKRELNTNMEIVYDSATHLDFPLTHDSTEADKGDDIYIREDDCLEEPLSP